MSHGARLLLIHDGELDDVQGLFAQLGVEYVERVGGPTRDDHETPWRVVVGTARRVLELQVGAAGEKPTRIALIDGDSRTLVAMLRRSGVDLMVQKPVHPAVLRLLVVHALYQGPEKRRYQRITIGAPVRFRAGLRRRQATLADLSLKGCRLLSPHSANRDQAIRVQFPTTLGVDKAFQMKGRVVRSGPTDGAGRGMQAIAVSFDSVTRSEVNLLKQVLRAYADGPHVLDPQEQTASTTAEQARAGAAQAPKRSAAPVAEDRGPRGGAAGDSRRDTLEPEPQPESDADRRSEPRHSLDRHIIALGVEATRVLIGRDISLQGMRVQRNDTLCVGDDLRLAVHVRARSEPLVLRARVERDDGDEGLMLRFHDLSEAAETYLQKMVNFLPILAARGGDEGTGVIVSEILERDASGSELPPAETAEAVSA